MKYIAINVSTLNTLLYFMQSIIDQFYPFHLLTSLPVRWSWRIWRNASYELSGTDDLATMNGRKTIYRWVRPRKLRLSCTNPSMELLFFYTDPLIFNMVNGHALSGVKTRDAAIYTASKEWFTLGTGLFWFGVSFTHLFYIHFFSTYDLEVP